MAGDRHEGAFVFGAVLGAVASAVATLLLTPRSGDSVRAELTERGRELQERVRGLSSLAQERSRDLVEQGRQALGMAEETELPVPAAAVAPVPFTAPAVQPVREAKEAVQPVGVEDTALLPPVTSEAGPEDVADAPRPEHAGDDAL